MEIKSVFFDEKCPILPDFDWDPSTTSLLIIIEAPKTVEEWISKILFNFLAQPIDFSAKTKAFGIFSTKAGIPISFSIVYLISKGFQPK